MDINDLKAFAQTYAKVEAICLEIMDNLRFNPEEYIKKRR